MQDPAHNTYSEDLLIRLSVKFETIWIDSL
jgi:hypothetical protein